MPESHTVGTSVPAGYWKSLGGVVLEAGSAGLFTVGAHLNGRPVFTGTRLARLASGFGRLFWFPVLFGGLCLTSYGAAEFHNRNKDGGRTAQLLGGSSMTAGGLWLIVGGVIRMTNRKVQGIDPINRLLLGALLGGIALVTAGYFLFPAALLGAGQR